MTAASSVLSSKPLWSGVWDSQLPSPDDHNDCDDAVLDVDVMLPTVQELEWTKAIRQAVREHAKCQLG